MNQLVLCSRNIAQNIIQLCKEVSIRHSRAGGNPVILELDSRLRGSDIHFTIYLEDMTLSKCHQARLSSSAMVLSFIPYIPEKTDHIFTQYLPGIRFTVAPVQQRIGQAGKVS